MRPRKLIVLAKKLHFLTLSVASALLRSKRTFANKVYVLFGCLVKDSNVVQVNRFKFLFDAGWI